MSGFNQLNRAPEGLDMHPRLPELSALLDGEIEPHEVRAAVAAASADGELQDRWLAYNLIGDSLRGEGASRDLTADIMARIREEPVVLAPGNLQRRKSHHPAFALAASVAGMAIVGWLAIGHDSSSGVSVSATATLAAVSPTPTFMKSLERHQEAQAKKTMDEGRLKDDMSEFLLAHHTQASVFRLGDNTEHIRTISLPARQ